MKLEKCILITILKTNSIMKKNGQFDKKELETMPSKIKDTILELKKIRYVSPKQYGIAIANSPRHRSLKGKRMVYLNKK